MGDEELLVNLGLYMRSGALAKLLFLNELYQKILPIPGILCEFGIWWGQSLAMFENLRAVYEPYNHARRMVGFDTFEGYKEIGEKDKRSATISEGVYGVPAGYENYLDQLLDYHEQENVMGHIRKHKLVKGDATVSCRNYLAENPEVFVALAFFDMALYEPTKACLEAIAPRLIKGSVVAFDELNHRDYPGGNAGGDGSAGPAQPLDSALEIPAGPGVFHYRVISGTAAPQSICRRHPCISIAWSSSIGVIQCGMSKRKRIMSPILWQSSVPRSSPCTSKCVLPCWKSLPRSDNPRIRPMRLRLKRVGMPRQMAAAARILQHLRAGIAALLIFFQPGILAGQRVLEGQQRIEKRPAVFPIDRPAAR